MSDKQLGWGLCMEGNETFFTQLLRQADAAPADPFTYLEIGFGGGQTMAKVGSLLADRRGPVTLYGFDLPNGWSVEPEPAAVRIREAFPMGRGRTVHLVLESGRVWLRRQRKPLGVNLAFIDGCHGAPCVVADFIALAPHLVPGGIVLFHDASPQCQGHHMQPHCGTGIDVRAALNQLGLFENWLPGWKCLGETNANHGIAAFQWVGE